MNEYKDTLEAYAKRVTEALRDLIDATVAPVFSVIEAIFLSLSTDITPKQRHLALHSKKYRTRKKWINSAIRRSGRK